MVDTTSLWTFRSTLAAAVMFGTIAGAHALPVYDQFVTGDDLVDSRALGGIGGLVKGGGNVSSATLSWDIGYDTNTGRWSYSYSFSENSPQGISHLILDLSDNCGPASGCIIDFSDNSTKADKLVYSTFTTAGNPGFAGSIAGVKFDDLSVSGTYTFSFVSERAPVWGDFYAKGGNGTSNGFAIFNAGATDHGSEFESDFIARPDTVTGPGPGGAGDPVPAPATLLLLATGLIGLAAGGRRRA